MTYAYATQRNREGKLRAVTVIPLGSERRELRITTEKSARPGVETRAMVVTVHENGLGYTHAFGLGTDCGDFSIRVAHEPDKRATEKAIRELHEKSLQLADDVLTMAKNYYLRRAA